MNKYVKAMKVEKKKEMKSGSTYTKASKKGC